MLHVAARKQLELNRILLSTTINSDLKAVDFKARQRNHFRKGTNNAV